MAQQGDPRRFYELDSLRGLAALTVVFHHFSRLCSPQTTYVIDRTPLRLLVAGHQAVILFFLLSGFVLTLPYKKNGSLNYGPFLLKRVCRIYLPYLGALAFAVLCDLHFSDHSHYDNYWIDWTWSARVTTRLVLQHILFLGNYDWSQFNTAFWSLVYEMRISLAFPFLALAVLRLRSLWIALAAAVLSLSFFPLAMILSSTLPFTNRTAAINTTLTLHYAAFFLMGSLVAKHLDAINRSYARLSALQAGVIAVVSLALYAFANASSLTQRFSIPADLYDWGAAAGAAALLVFAMNSRPFHTFLTTRPVHHLGQISYSLYLVHGTTLFVLIHTFLGRVSMSRLLLIYLFATLLIAEIFHRLIEHPAMLLGRRLTTPRQPLLQADSSNSTDSPVIARPPA
ncbi:MAG TPA: acyltransferase [Edaphobacter sp.]|nr:acyltransferase [Edaphobacter sp.]